MANNKVINELVKLGFTQNDVDIYQALINSGPTSAGTLISSTRFHRNVVYTSLEHLIQRKLVSEKIIKGVKHFSITDPNVLVSEFAKKQETAKEISETISKLSSRGQIQEITIHQGNEEYLDLLTGIIEILPKGATVYVFGTGGEAFMNNTMRPIWKKYHKVALKQGIKIRMLSYESQRLALENDIKNPPIYNVRYLPDDTENPAGIHIYPEAETVLNIIYSDDLTPVTAIKIKNKQLTNSYLKLFNNLWKAAEE